MHWRWRCAASCSHGQAHRRCPLRHQPQRAHPLDRADLLRRRKEILLWGVRWRWAPSCCGAAAAQRAAGRRRPLLAQRAPDRSAACPCELCLMQRPSCRCTIAAGGWRGHPRLRQASAARAARRAAASAAMHAVRRRCARALPQPGRHPGNQRWLRPIPERAHASPRGPSLLLLPLGRLSWRAVRPRHLAGADGNRDQSNICPANNPRRQVPPVQLGWSWAAAVPTKAPKHSWPRSRATVASNDKPATRC